MKRDLKVAYILHRFPYLTETFIMRELYWIRKCGVQVQIFSLLATKDKIVHEQAKELLPYVTYSPFLSWKVLKANFHFLGRSPGRYLRALTKMIWQTYREPRVLLRALALFPKSVLFARQMKALGIEHIHAHFVWLEGLAAGVVADLVDISFSIHPHAFGLFGRNQRDVRCELENASQVITISNFNRHYIANLCPSIKLDDIEVVYCGLEPDRFLPAPSKSPPEGEPICILSVGRLIEKKGFEYLIDACDMLAEQGLNFKCYIAGSGPFHQALQSRIDLFGLQDKVKLLGALDQERLIELYRQSHIFALACVVASNGDRDGIPVVLMEAMACEMPVVTTPVTGIPDLVQDGETGLLVQEKDVPGLAEALQKLIQDEDLRMQLGQKARQIVLDKFHVQNNAAKMAAIFRQVAGHKTPQNGVAHHVSKPWYAHPAALVESEYIGENTKIWAFAHILKDVEIGRECNIGDHCYIESNVRIGECVTIKNGTAVWEGVTIERGAFVGPNVAFTNDLLPRSPRLPESAERYKDKAWLKPTLLEEGCSIGANATIVCGVTIGQYAVVGAGSVVTKDVPPFSLVYGNPAAPRGYVCKCGNKLEMVEEVGMCASCGQSYRKCGHSIHPLSEAPSVSYAAYSEGKRL